MTDPVRTAKAIVRGYKIARMYAAGKTHAEIGVVFGICRQRVSQLLQMHRDRLARASQEPPAAAPEAMEAGT